MDGHLVFKTWRIIYPLSYNIWRRHHFILDYFMSQEAIPAPIHNQKAVTLNHGVGFFVHSEGESRWEELVVASLS